MTGREWLLLGILALIWGSGFFFTRIAVRDFSPATLIAVRSGLSAIILFALVRKRRLAIPERTWDAWRPFVILGLFNVALPFTLNAWGLTRIESGLAGILTATVPLFTVIIAHLATQDERLTPPVALGIGVGLCGVITILGLDLSTLFEGSGLAMLAVLASSAIFGVVGVYGRRVRGFPPLVMALGQMSTATVLLLPLVLFEQPWDATTPTSDGMLSLAALTLSTVVAYIIYFRLLAVAGAVATSMVAYVIPVIAVFLGVVFLDEHLEPHHFAGMALILAAMGLLDGRLVQWLTSRRAAPADQTAD
jgi:drug/metabolite transporter (DMT)-like permease